MRSKRAEKQLFTVKWKSNSVVMIDQTKLPRKLVYVKYTKYKQVAKAIEKLIVRGAPAIGVAAAYGLSLAAIESKAKTKEGLMHDLEIAYRRLKSTRPTAVNLIWALDLIMNKARKIDTVRDIKRVVLESSMKIAEDDIENNKKLGSNGSNIISDNDVILTHCNAGSLATVSYGTALGIIRSASEKGKKIKVIATETRPVMQGSRLTAFELDHSGIDVSLIPDTAVGYLMSSGLIKVVIVGADRVLKTGHVFNKIGTYQVAVLANRHKIPFYVAAPISTFDMNSTVDDIVIEHRNKSEVTHIGNKLISPKNVNVYNPAFDITPPELITGIVTERRIIHPPYMENIAKNLPAVRQSI
ncbi:MAG: S-methyl-5-thioribose-1-phosphate isomerase [Nitrososphaeraceae archaeon]